MALGNRALAAIGAAAIAAAALIALLLLGGSPGDGGATGAVAGSGRLAPETPAAPAPITREQAAALAEHDPDPPEPPPVAEGPSVEVRVLLDGVQPVPGCPVMGVERDADGELLVCFGDDGPASGETDGDGRFLLRWPAEPKERLVAVFVDRKAKVDRFEGADRIGALSMGHPVLRAGTAPVTVHLAEDGGPPRIRILEDATGAPLGADIDPVVEFGVPGVPAPGAIQRVSIRHEGGGWWIANGIPDDVLGPRLRTAGYREAALEGWDARGRRTVRLQPSGTGVTGVLETPAAGGPGMEASIHRDDRPGFDFSALGRLEPGSFRIDGLEPGWWNLEVQWHPKGGEAASSWWTLQRFEYAGGLLDLGTLRAVPGSTLRVRWASTTPWPEGAKLSLWRAGGPESAPPPLAGEAPIADGAFLFRGLRPGGEYYVTCARFPGWSENVLAPDEPGAERTHEAGLDLRLVKCRISFTIDGAKSTRPLMVRGPGVSKILASEDDYVECTIPPGSHAFACHVVDVEQTGETGVVRVKQRGSSLLVAHVEVPNEPEFVATVDLKSK